MLCLVLLLLLVLPADELMQEAVRRRGQPAEARALLLQARAEYRARGDVVAGEQFATNWARVEYLLGETAGAVAVLHWGLSQHPHDAELQRDLAILRSQLAYPTGTAAPPQPGFRSRFGELDLFVLTMLAGLLACVAVTLWLTVRSRWAYLAVTLAAVLVAVLVGIRIGRHREAIHDHEQPIRVLARPTVLMAGNGPSYAPRLNQPLPAGAEVQVIGTRGAWHQVQVYPDILGWLPEGSLFSEALREALPPPGESAPRLR